MGIDDITIDMIKDNTINKMIEFFTIFFDILSCYQLGY